MKRQYSEEIKAQVMAALLAGQSVSQTAKSYDIPEGTIKVWMMRERETEETTVVTSDVTTKREQMGALILDYLAENLITLRKQLKTFCDEEWLKKQSASELAVLHGVIADKSFRLLDALAERPGTSTDG